MSFITVDGRTYKGRYIGRGSFSKVYKVGNRVVYYTDGDCAKEAQAMFQYSRLTHLPELIRHDNINIYNRRGEIVGVRYVFSSPYYRNVTRKDRSAYELMNHIMRLYVIFIGHERTYSNRSIEYDVYLMQKFVNFLEESNIPRSVVRALQALVYVASNCGSGVFFDIHKANFGVNDYGVLIFRDLVAVTKL
jgi:hypothetical protein